MTTLPTLPTISSYGSVAVMVDAVPLKDASSEWSATSINPLRNDLTSAAQTSAKCLFQFDGYNGPVAITPTATWATGFDGHWGNTEPILYPTLTRASQGVINVQMPASVPDAIGGSNLINVRAVKASVASGTAPATFICTVTSASTFTISIFNPSGTATDLVGSLILVEVF